MLPDLAWSKSQLAFACASDSDLVTVLESQGHSCWRYDSAAQAIDAAPPEGGVLVLADLYPDEAAELSPDLLDEAHRKRLRLYVEYASKVGRRVGGLVASFKRERAVVSSDRFGPDLPPMKILALHDCHFIPMTSDSADIVAAVVGGFDRAVFGLPQKRHPLLFEETADLWIATTKLSQFVTARYGPESAIKTIWEMILFWASRGACRPDLQWTPTVRPLFGRDEPLPPAFEKLAFDRGVEWHYKSRLIVHPKRFQFCLDNNPEIPQPRPPEDLPNGDGRYGITEGYCSYIYHDGSQRQRVGFRSDALTETAMAMALAWQVNRRPQDRELAENLMEFIYSLSELQQGPMADPKHPSFGLIWWGLHMQGNSPWDRQYLGSDNRQLMASVATAVLLDSDRWDERVLRAIFAVERVTGPRGFGDRMSTADLEKNGWRFYSDLDFPPEKWAISDTPSRFLMAYALTGCESLLIKGKRAIECLMDLYPDGLTWWNTVNSATSNLILSLAWLVRLEDTREHRGWLYRVVNDLLVLQQPCGAIREDVGAPGRGMVSGYGPCRSNEDYGTRESVLIQRNGDPMTDVLYCDNFALVSLHEAFAVTGDPYVRQAEDRLAEFLCRVQVRSERHPYLDGGWYRSFDYGKWEYWGNNSDVGWGSWALETGWSQAWTLTGLALRQMNVSLWDICMKSQIRRALPKVQEQMRMNDGRPL